MATKRSWQACAVAMLACALVTTIGSALAQEVTNADELVKQLEIEPQPKSAIRTRGIEVSVSNADQGRASLNTIQFEYDSATLTAESTDQLVELGKALTDERLFDESFIIEGHADAHGDDQYNKNLSLRRAVTVKNYLVNEMGIAEARLRTIGMGEEKPKTDDPYDAENRRVDVVNINVPQ